MKIHHLRNATLILTLGHHRLLVDPMLSPPGALPGFKLIGGGRRNNPLVPLPGNADAALDEVTGILVTHEHPDHFDPPAIEWITSRNLPVFAAAVDVPNLRKKGLGARVADVETLGIEVHPIPVRHGRGPIGWLMGPVTGFVFDHPGEPTVFLTSDAVMTPALLETIDRHQPDVVVAPAGAANFGMGSDLLFSADELVELVRRSPGRVVLNHLEALDHCPTTRVDLGERMEAEGLADRVWIPDDGDVLEFDQRNDAPGSRPEPLPGRGPGVQKWLTSFFTGT